MHSSSARCHAQTSPRPDSTQLDWTASSSYPTYPPRSLSSPIGKRSQIWIAIQRPPPNRSPPFISRPPTSSLILAIVRASKLALFLFRGLCAFTIDPTGSTLATSSTDITLTTLDLISGVSTQPPT
ncbi:hypothetical protein PSEUBRA_001818 [Kalmanozyma brasiliensis GHG001]|uniref:uncharacterized protein n=1 Tax=Kalmanozyma brasiliensis (strain GHG001) TaxID=1365824 RepID=UPI002867E581|nr:uncharacterized protein PSEUBRA_001818 [Kalmanozyma brasiliensis GHG001]KAF6767002.1 hypothetical protein PSEUBRA_001818 [Kalmanozyma brasiliensis GHG001]